MEHPARTAFDLGFLGLAVAAIFDQLPRLAGALTAVFAAAWWGVKLYETRTVQAAVARWRGGKSGD